MNEYAVNPLHADLAFQASGVLLLALGALLMADRTPAPG